MKRYFFHLRDGREFERDEYGSVLPSDAAAVRQAVRLFHSTLGEAKETRPFAGLVLHVEDQKGRTIVRVPFTAVH